ncbi:hypothetical protein GCM10022216_32430 [Sphingobacterium kyonggiense]|uniref:Response regulatory domain-containing protein n=1 Tax=Sphingobacterium kyonggiense TaxID=714075 RepID=A0ABP7Z3Z8_9SPHI
MIKKVLIAEDHEIANISVQKTLHDLGIPDAKYVFYCDHALTWIKKALQDAEPYDLLLTDIEFDDDANPQTLKNGIELIRAVKAIQPDIKIIILSALDRSLEIDQLFDIGYVDAYVRKARRDAQHLREALHAISLNKTYKSPETRKIIQDRNAHDFSNLDMHIVKLLYEGIPQKEMPHYLQQRNIRPSSLSSIEKRLNLMKEVLSFSKNEQLVAYCKEIGLV